MCVLWIELNGTVLRGGNIETKRRTPRYFSAQEEFVLLLGIVVVALAVFGGDGAAAAAAGKKLLLLLLVAGPLTAVSTPAPTFGSKIIQKIKRISRWGPTRAGLWRL